MSGGAETQIRMPFLSKCCALQILVLFILQMQLFWLKASVWDAERPPVRLNLLFLRI